MNAECLGIVERTNGYVATQPWPVDRAPTDVQWVNSLIDTSGSLVETIIDTASEKAQQERAQEFELAKMQLTLPTQQQMQQAAPWLMLAIPAGILFLMLARRRR
jgi:hypothetical protein